MNRFSDTVVETMSSTKYSPAAKRNLKELQYLAKKVKNIDHGKWKGIDYVAKAKKSSTSTPHDKLVTTKLL